MAEAGSAGQVLEVALARSLAGSHRVLQTPGPPTDGRFPQEVYLLQVRLYKARLFQLHPCGNSAWLLYHPSQPQESPMLHSP